MWQRLRASPALSNGLAGAFTFGAGDAVSQTRNGGSLADINIVQSIHISCLGIVMNAGVLRFWYGLLDRTFSASMNDLRVVFAKCAADQIAMAPFSICTYFGYTQLLTHGFNFDTGPKIAAKIGADLVPTWKMDCLVWPPANFLCYRLVPVGYRPMFVGFVQLGWQLYIARVARKDV